MIVKYELAQIIEISGLEAIHNTKSTYVKYISSSLLAKEINY